jgi:cystathionine beta-lyase/cystathionine gamma-synthase
MSALEGGEDALAFSSGMGATAAFFQSIEPRSHVIIPEDVYVQRARDGGKLLCELATGVYDRGHAWRLRCARIPR